MNNLENDIRKREDEIVELEDSLNRKNENIEENEARMALRSTQNEKLLTKVSVLEKKIATLEKDEHHCDRCSKSFKNNEETESHIPAHHAQQPLSKKSIKCIFNDRGFCRYGRHCRFQHGDQACELGQSCLIQQCQNRHPQPCKFGMECIFGPRCDFLHRKHDFKSKFEEEITVWDEKTEEETYEEGIEPDTDEDTDGSDDENSSMMQD